ncbi:ATP/maltotriose-dependent transcriptional regulator MalT [Rhizobium sp. BK529]|uniref:ATP-binding protein n=1 Tax=unclassified Rhizobium TaxID=2613769 RepID=UPI00104CDF8B|nr:MULTISPECIES: AAA family ATPase [unclassified Rhizobium]MBB3590623.1 ATP/maltotriose-dependent transcriptional regulator MalT [Rhizobium sp. BK529]TCS05315.1 LuxR family transcriptional regulator [Rhizobium sp. BK418]
MRLIERAPILDHLQSLLREAADGESRVVLLEGEAGAGKSSLAAAFSRAVPEGTRVLSGACENFGTAEPLGPWRDIAREARWKLTRVSAGNWISLFSEVLDLLTADRQPTLLVIEDIHWADDATLNLIRYIGRRIRNTCLLPVLTARNDDTPGQTRLRRLLADIPPAHWLRIDVPPLSKASVLELAQQEGLDGEAIFSATGGNAYFVSELVDAASRDRLPTTIRDAVLARADTLSEADRAVLCAASTSPDAFAPELIEAICGENARRALEACVACGLLVPAGDLFMFRHEIARQAIEQSLPPLRRRGLNERALAYFRQSGDASVARMVHHANEAQDIAAISELAPKAAAEAGRLGAHRQAIRHYELALAHAGALGDAARACLYEGYAFECHLTGQMERAIAAQTSALSLYRSLGDIRHIGDNMRWLSRLSYLAGDRKGADAFGREAVEVLEQANAPAELAMGYSNLSQLGMLAGDAETATFYGERAIALMTAEDVARPEVLCHALNNVGTAICWRDPDRARQTLEEALAIALDHGFQEHIARAFTNRAWVEIQLHAAAAAEDVLTRGIAYCIEHDLDTWRDYMRGELAELLTFLGRWEEAAAAAQAVVDNQNAPALSRYPSLVALATLRTRRGEPADALLQEMEKFLANTFEFQRLSAHAALMAERAWLGLADRDAALAALRQAASLCSDDAPGSTIGFWAHILGEPGLAPDNRNGDAAVTAMLEGRWQEAADIWTDRRAPYLAALALLDGDSDALYRALATLETLGATTVVTHVKDMIRKRSGRLATRGPRASTQANAAGLTTREMDVLRLIDEGRSNAEIGAQLFVSAKTVDHHISSILAKLNAKSRGQAAAEGRRLGLLG